MDAADASKAGPVRSGIVAIRATVTALLNDGICSN
jgi:hypothetical protein